MSDHHPSLAAGIQFHQSGQLDQAEQIYRQVAANDPSNADAHSLLGAVCINQNRLDEAAKHLNDALRIEPDHQAAHDNLGVLLGRQGRFEEAVASFERSLAIHPDQPATLQNLAEAQSRCGRTEQAIATFRRVVTLAPNSVRAHMELAQALVAKQNVAEAVAHWQQVARLTPGDARVHFELAAALARVGRMREAKQEYCRALELKPDSAETCVNLGGVCIKLNELDEAVEYFQRAIGLRPNFAEAHLNLGCALTRQHKTSESIEALQTAIRLNPELSEAHNNLGIALAADARYAEAVGSYEQAIVRRPDNVDAIYNLGIAHLKQGMVASALDHFEQALELRPDYAEAHHNRSAALLLSENFDEGLAEYEWRFRSRDYGPFKMRWPAWDGGDLTDRTIVLIAEQGLGDSIQFIRYASLVKDRGARVVVECPGLLHALLARTPGVDQWITPETPPPEADCCVPLLSLPHRLETRFETIPAEVPYVFADPDLVDTWQSRLAEHAGLRIGIAWQGNPRCPEDRFRSIPLSAFEPLAKLPDVCLVSLQKGHGAEQLDDVRGSWPLVDFGDELDATGGAFMDTAAIMKNLDLVVTSDTAAAHLAGALGVPVWVALPYVPDWRWLLECDDSPWYPTMRLFRQTKWGRWDDVFRGIAAEVQTLAARGGQAAR